ncbi:hypothetical protein Psta_1867 [Pirellula staleyi DSM 6068]|uniref:Uncharacterized protein n=1 Tax=Pirellula staleyi (strain ATCC 27377 / DSM 6068 / ICPB 4128) TaxID=530564 RepID=D2QZQ8_PIRSD|nr:hypothetical protein Psta_1867 [Pirellula staleyi DSM 6068]
MREETPGGVSGWRVGALSGTEYLTYEMGLLTRGLQHAPAAGATGAWHPVLEHGTRLVYVDSMAGR